MDNEPSGLRGYLAGENDGPGGATPIRSADEPMAHSRSWLEAAKGNALAGNAAAAIRCIDAALEGPDFAGPGR